jgi:WD40 repeat protein
MLPIMDAAAEQDDSVVPKVLAVIQDSQGEVLTVKFSHCGTMLAAGCSAAADSAVLIFKQSPAPAMAKQLGSKFLNIENWRPVGSLRGHGLDITALTWSADDGFLASSSMDGKVCIWAMGKGEGCCCWLERAGELCTRLPGCIFAAGAVGSEELCQPQQQGLSRNRVQGIGA